jgi:hypothetical protein
VENIPLQAERHSGRRAKLFAFPPESRSPSHRNAVRNHNGMAFSFSPESRSPSTGFPTQSFYRGAGAKRHPRKRVQLKHYAHIENHNGTQMMTESRLSALMQGEEGQQISRLSSRSLCAVGRKLVNMPLGSAMKAAFGCSWGVLPMSSPNVVASLVQMCRTASGYFESLAGHWGRCIPHVARPHYSRPLPNSIASSL